MTIGGFNFEYVVKHRKSLFHSTFNSSKALRNTLEGARQAISLATFGNSPGRYLMHLKFSIFVKHVTPLNFSNSARVHTVA